jgi:hypothetical protein
MIVDDTLVLSDHQAITATARSTDIIDLGATGTAFGHAAALARDVGKAISIPLFISITETFNNLTSLTVQIEVDDDPAFGSPRIVAAGPAITLAGGGLASGQVVQFPAELPEGTNERFLGLRYTVAGAAPTTGKVFAGIVAGRQTNP